jgi:arsenate reductase
MAAAFFNSLADPNKARAVSAGTEPADKVHAEVTRVMRELDFDLSQAKPQKLTPEVAAGAEMLITMGCKENCPFIPGAQVLDWPLPDPKSLALFRVREIRDEIRSRVEKLIEQHHWQKP